MNDILTITKQPIVEEDLGLENTPVIQFRDEKEVWVTPLKLFKIADNLEQLRVTDFNKFSQGVVFGGAEGSVGNNCFYKWFPESTEVESIPDVVTSKLSETGRWIKQDIGGSAGQQGNFVTLDTEQSIEQNATKTWYNFNKFYGYNQAGQVALIKDNNSQNLKLTLCETDESSISAHFGYPSRTSQNLEIFNKLDGEIAVNRDIVFSDRGEDTFNDIGFIGYTRDNRDNLIISNTKSDKVYIANSIVGTDPYYVPKFSLSSLNDKLQITNEASGEIELNRNLTFSGGRKNISFVATPTLAHQATPKDYVDTADQALDAKIQQNTQGLADANSRLDAVDDKLLQLSGASKIIGQINQTKDQVETNRETILNAFVQQVKSRVPEEGDTVFTTDNYAYYYTTSWSQPYTISINIANTTTAGLVLSTANSDSNRGKIYVNPSNGVMNVIGQVAYLDTTNTFTQNNTFNGTSFVVNSKSAQLNSFVEIGAAGGGSLQPTDHLISIDGGNGVGVPSRLRGKAVYSKDISLFDVADYEIINYNFVREHLATLDNVVTIAGTQTITGAKTFTEAVTIGNSNTEKRLYIYGSNRCTNTVTADTNLFVGLDHSDTQGGNSLFRVQYNPSQPNSNGAFYNKTLNINSITDNEIINYKFFKENSGGGGSTPANMVTTDTTQTITGAKTFSGVLSFSWHCIQQTFDLPGLPSVSSFGAFSNDVDGDTRELNIVIGESKFQTYVGGRYPPIEDWIKFIYKGNTITYSSMSMEFMYAVTIENASFGTSTYALDPVWEQDYATANYVNQKLQQLYDHIDSRLRALEQAVNVPTTLADTRVVKAMIDNMRVPKSKITTLYEELDSLEGYEGLIGMSSTEERQKIFATDDRAEQLRILDEIKARKEEEERQRAERYKQQQNEV